MGVVSDVTRMVRVKGVKNFHFRSNIYGQRQQLLLFVVLGEHGDGSGGAHPYTTFQCHIDPLPEAVCVAMAT